MSHIVEKSWTTETGLPAAVVINPCFGHRCGYVAVPEGHPFHGDNYDQHYGIDVHGGLTYAGSSKHDYPVAAPGYWWFGFDCNHLGDRGDPAFANDDGKLYLESMQRIDPNAKVRSLAYVERECEKLAKQLASPTVA